MIENGADVNSKDNSGRTPLHTAAGSGFAKIIDILIQNGANIDAVDQNGWSPIFYAASVGKIFQIERCL